MLELHGLGEMAIQKTASAISILTRHGYCEVVRIKTGPSPSLRISIKPSEKFNSTYEAFADELSKRRQADLERRLAAQAEKEKGASSDSVKAEAGGSSEEH